MQVTIKNISTETVYISTIANTLAASASITISRTLSDLDEDVQLKNLVAAGSVTVDYSLDAGDKKLGFLPSAFEASTTDVWVDGTLGVDTQAGTSAAPVKTISEALRRLPLVTDRSLTVHVKAGTYAETLNPVCVVKNMTSKLTIKGEDWTAATGLVGQQTGTFTAATAAGNTLNGTATMASGTWDVNELQGKFVKITSGALSGGYFPVASNTGTVIEFCGTTASMNGATFEVVNPAVIVSAPTTATPCAVINGIGPRFSSASGVTIQMESLKFSGATAADAAVVVSGGGHIYFKSCSFGVAVRGILVGNVGVQLGGESCFFDSQTSNGIRVFAGGYVGFVQSYFKGTGGATIGLYLGAVGKVLLTSNTFDGWGTGISVDVGPKSVNGTPLYVRNGTVGIDCSGAGDLTIPSGRITLTSSHGIRMFNGTSGNGGMSLRLGADVYDCGGDGVRMESSHNNVVITGTVVNSEHTGIGFNMSASKGASFNNLSVEGTLTMANNGGGDIQLDGSTQITRADLANDADKNIVEAALRFNRASEN